MTEGMGMADFTHEHWEGACAALDLNPETTLSINISPDYVRIVHSDQAVTAQRIGPEPTPMPTSATAEDEEVDDRVRVRHQRTSLLLSPLTDISLVK